MTEPDAIEAMVAGVVNDGWSRSTLVSVNLPAIMSSAFRALLDGGYVVLTDKEPR